VVVMCLDSVFVFLNVLKNLWLLVEIRSLVFIVFLWRVLILLLVNVVFMLVLLLDEIDVIGRCLIMVSFVGWFVSCIYFEW